MSKKFIQRGDVMDYANGSTAIAVDSVVVLGARIGVALADIAANTVGPLAVSEVFSLPKKSGDTFTQGALAYWDSTNKQLTSTASGNTLAGYAFQAGASVDTTLAIKING